MRAVVQRTSRAAVTVAGAVVGQIGAGLLVLLGVGPGDTDAVAEKLAGRVATLRIFPDSAGRMSLDLTQSGGAVLVVSQFTLFADSSTGHRPSFAGAAERTLAERLCLAFVASLQARGLDVAAGVFGAHMDVELVNDGPVTVVLSSGEEAWNTDAG
jgi:D-tyrosyl-tRNA(Tyr) deacylase